MTTVVPIPWQPPEHVFAHVAHEPWAIFLHSARLDNQFGRYSYIGVSPSQTLTSKQGDDDFFDRLKTLSQSVRTIDNSELPPFQGGIMGFWGYELHHQLEAIPQMPMDTLPFLDAAVGFYDTIIAFDHAQTRAHIISIAAPALAQDKIATLQYHLAQHRLDIPTTLVCPEEITSNFSPTSYAQAVSKTIEAILAGDFFEANISQQFKVPRPKGFSPYGLFLNSLRCNAAPFAAYMNTPSGTIVSASPERFLWARNNHVITCPIKGTRPRSTNAAADAALKEALSQSEKDRAENVMIVDLMRNDISRVCDTHSVAVPHLCDVHSFATVHHLVSTVTGTLRDDDSLTALLKACFPGGSITGAPKVEVMKHIAATEQVRRGPYCGSLGYIGANNTLDTSIAIRTFTITPDMIYFQAGGAITMDSCPTSEYQETLDKAQALRQALTVAL